MNLIWRLLWVILFSRFSPTVTLFDKSYVHFRVLPTDVDVLLHMNNGRYFSFLDLARIDFMIRNKTFAILKKQKIYGVVASEMIRFRRSINLFKRFQISTQLLGWDNNFFYILHYFTNGAQVCALSSVKICFLHHSRGRIMTKEILALLGVPDQAKEMPTWVKDWQAVDRDFYNFSKRLT